MLQKIAYTCNLSHHEFLKSIVNVITQYIVGFFRICFRLCLPKKIPFFDLFISFQGIEDVTPGINNLLEFPQEEESALSSIGLDFEPILAEIDEDTNKFIFGMKKECSRDQLDYCAGNKYKSGDHTMCKYCVSIENIQYNRESQIHFIQQHIIYYILIVRYDKEQQV